MLRYDHQDSIIFWVVSTSHLFQRVFNDELSHLGMTFRQAEVLAWLAMEGQRISQAELARRMQIAAPTLGGIVDRMERDGWIMRESCETDRRKMLLQPTAKVEPIWEQIREVGLRIRARATQGFTPEQVRYILTSLETIQGNIRDFEAELKKAK